jgi:hypothetical protein
MGQTNKTDKFVYPVAKYCPSECYGTFLTPIMRGTIVTLFARLTQSWDKINSTGKGYHSFSENPHRFSFFNPHSI